MGLEQVQQALARLVATHEQDVRGPVLPSGDGDRVGESPDVHAVGDDLVVAGKEAIDEVAGGGADRDTAVQAPRVPPERPAPELVGRREPGIGVERGDVDALRLSQQEQRQERDERLVEVEDVELLAVEHRPDLRQVARREGQRPDGRVDRYREPDAEADDVALGRSLGAVARGQDADVVAAQSEVLVQEPDVLGDAAVLRIDVRTDEADLHGVVSSGGGGAAGASNRGGRARPPG